MTWKELQLATIQKMFSADGATIPSDDSTRDYLAAMPFAANEGILMMATAGKFVVKSVSVSINPIPNLLGSLSSSKIVSMINGTKEYKMDRVKSYYFECSGKCEVTISIDDEVIETIDIEHFDSYKAYKGLIDNSENKVVTITFNSEYPYTIKNMALYEAKFIESEDIPAFAEKIRYRMDELVDDFHTIHEIIYEGNSPKYINTDDVFREGDKTLVFDRDKIGDYIVYYNALPPTLSAGTEDDYELPLDKEVVALLPIYIASQLYKEDDIAIATQYRNEFEVGFERLTNSTANGKAESVVSESGWI